MSTTILYLGPEGTHSHEAAARWHGTIEGLSPCRSLKEVFASLTRDPQAVAIVPVENSVEGPVTQTLDLLASTPDVRAREAFGMRIRQHLLASRGTPDLASVRTVYSHAQALGQCADWLAERLPAAGLVPLASTAEAARRAASEPGAAALAGDLAARLYGLATLAADAQDVPDNVTRFLVLAVGAAAVAPHGDGPVRSLLHLVLPDRPGSLLHALEPFHAAGLNLTSIQSRPLRGRPWEYGFFVETAGDVTASRYAGALARLRAHAETLRLLGVYPNAAGNSEP
jgi:chorismate mutase/prephenate dehydratase